MELEQDEWDGGGESGDTVTRYHMVGLDTAGKVCHSVTVSRQ
jgi:hypothetical protein